MRKRTWILLVVSALLTAMTLVFWVRSYLVRDVVSYTTARHNQFLVCSYLGRVHLMRVRDWTYTSGFQAVAMRLSEQGKLQNWEDDYKPEWNDQYPAPR